MVEIHSCKLCNQSIAEKAESFCCLGCQTVFNILSTRNELAEFQNHPLFKQALKSGLISNPALLEEIRSRQINIFDPDKEKLHLEIQDLWCPSCGEIIRLLLLREKGVFNCIVDYSTDLASIEFSPKQISKDRLLGIIKKIGYTPLLFDRDKTNVIGSDLYLRMIVAAFFSANIMMFSYPIYASYFTLDPNGYSRLFAWVSLFSSFPVLFYSAWPIFKRFFKSITFGFTGMETLIVMGVSSSFGMSIYELAKGGTHVYFDSMAVIITFVLLGKMIESKAKFSTKETLFRLTKAIPKRGRKSFSDGRENFVLTKEITRGDKLVVLSGEKIVLDGVVIEGEGNCDESLMTGEPIPIRKRPGDKVLAGTILSLGRLVYRVESIEDETALHHIIETIESDIGKKSHYSRAIDPIVKKFIPIVILIAISTGFVVWMNGNSAQYGIIRAVSILLISCPCAIGIAAPIVEAQILNSMAELGAIMRNRGCLKNFGNEDFFVFDKTGTITEGIFQVLGGLEGISRDDLQVLKSMARQTTHPVSAAIDRNISAIPATLERCEEIPGKGMKAQIESCTYLLGSREYLSGHEVEQVMPPKSNNQIVSQVYFSKNRKLLSTIQLGDQVRQEAFETVQALKPSQTILLSGDAAETVRNVAGICGFDSWKADISPLEKRDFIDNLRKLGNTVTMMGDGINDAPALTGANTGISVFNATDLSIQVSDIMLTTDRLTVIPKIRSISKKGQKIIRQNLFWAFFYNVIGIGLAVAGYLNPLLSSVAMVLSSLIVILNAQRVRE